MDVSFGAYSDEEGVVGNIAEDAKSEADEDSYDSSIKDNDSDDDTVSDEDAGNKDDPNEIVINVETKKSNENIIIDSEASSSSQSQKDENKTSYPNISDI